MNRQVHPPAHYGSVARRIPAAYSESDSRCFKFCNEITHFREAWSASPVQNDRARSSSHCDCAGVDRRPIDGHPHSA